MFAGIPNGAFFKLVVSKLNKGPEASSLNKHDYEIIEIIHHIKGIRISYLWYKIFNFVEGLVLLEGCTVI